MTERLSLAVGLDLVYLDTEIKANINQTAAGGVLPPLTLSMNCSRIKQKFSGDSWGNGYNLGVLFKATDRISICAAYRSQVDIDIEGDISIYGVTLRSCPTAATDSRQV